MEILCSSHGIPGASERLTWVRCVANIIVIDAHALLLATQREAVMPGVGLSRPIRPPQGPVCAGCRCLSTERRVSGELEPTSLDDGCRGVPQGEQGIL